MPTSRRVDDGRWHHVVAVYDRGHKDLYLDGELARSAYGPSEPFLSGAHWRLGCDSMTGWAKAPTTRGNLDGDFQFAGLFRRAFTAEDVRRHYTAGR